MTDNYKKDPEPATSQFPHTKTAKGGFTDGRRFQHVRSEIQRSVQNYPERPRETLDNADREIEAAIWEGRQINMDWAFPKIAKHPRGNRRKISRSESTPVNPGSNSKEPKREKTALDDPSSLKRSVAHSEGDHSTYAKEYRLTLVHRLTLRGLPLATIGGLLGITSRHVQSLRAELIRRLKKEGERTDIMTFVGETLAFYNEIRCICMEDASENTEASERLAALRAALAVEADKHRFLQACGYYDVAKYVPKKSAENDTAAALVAAVRQWSADLSIIEDNEKTEPGK